MLKRCSFVLLTAALACGFALTADAAKHPALQSVDDRSDIPDVPRDEVICFALYTVQDGVLKLSAHLYPLLEGEDETVALDVEENGEWKEIAQADVHPIGWTALFRIEDWDQSKDVAYRVRHSAGSTYEGLIRHDPIEKDEIVAALFTGNSPGPGGGKISKQDVVDNILKIDPDVLLFTGDQVYPHTTHTKEWLHFGELFGDMMRDRPTVTIPDDHDVGQPNLWGGGGKKVDLDTKGGYTRPAEYVKMVERQQTSHLPDPYDSTPIEQGIGVYYTSLNVGGIDFAIVEDRKFKSGCFDFDIKGKGLGPRPDHILSKDYDPADYDVEGKKFLGDRQLQFLDDWAQDWTDAVMKCLVSQTVFTMASTNHGGGYARYEADFDSGGWPQTGRDKAIDAMRKCFAFHACGDQHLATIVQYGIDEWRDSNFAFVTPSIANLYPRGWEPTEPSKNAEPGAQEFTGDNRDGFGNLLTVFAHTNPTVDTGREPKELHNRMPGFGVIRFSKPQRTITMECWPRMVDPTDPASEQYEGWPRTIHQYDNYGREAVAWLPEIRITGAKDQVVQIVDESNDEVVYTLRIQGDRFQPKVFREGKYMINVGEGDNIQIIQEVESGPKDDGRIIEVQM